MKAFCQLYLDLDATTSTSAKLAALTRYFRSASAADAAWATYFLAGGRPRQSVPTRLLRECAMERSGIDGWLFEECYQAVGDLAEMIALILPPPTHDSSRGLAEWVEQRLIPLQRAPPDVIRERLFEYWDELDANGKFLLLKLIGGGFRVGVSRLLVTRALAEIGHIDPKSVAQRLIGYTNINARPSAAMFESLIAVGDDALTNVGHPYPFFLAQALTEEVAQLGPVDDWMVEWKWDGIRAQLVKRAGACWLWSRGEELVTERFPEIERAGMLLRDGTVIDGEILVWKDGNVRPFAELQKRIGRKSLSPRILGDAPVVLLAYDLLEDKGTEIRSQPQTTRRHRLEAIVADTDDERLRLSPLVAAKSWAEYAAVRATSRKLGVEGFMLKRRDSPYGVGRTRDEGTWWKWKIDPMTVDAVLVYAQHGHGRRASLYTDYTFAVWADDADGGRMLVPFAKAYSGLTDEEIRQVDAVIRKTTIEKFGPVRSVTPSMVFELGFEAIQRSARHKSGIAVRFPRILRWRMDKPVAEADTLATLRALLEASDGADAP